MPIVYFRLPISDCRFPEPTTGAERLSIGKRQLAIGNALYRFAVINRVLALFQSRVGFLPRRLAPFITAAPRGLAHVVDRANVIDLHLEDGLGRRFDLRFRSVPIDPEG